MKSKHSLKVKMTLLTAKAHRDISSTKLVSSSVFLARYQGQCLKSSPIFWAQADPSLLQVELGYDVWSRCYVFYNRDVNRLPNNQRLFLHHLPAVTLVKEDESQHWSPRLIRWKSSRHEVKKRVKVSCVQLVLCETLLGRLKAYFKKQALIAQDSRLMADNAPVCALCQNTLIIQQTGCS